MTLKDYISQTLVEIVEGVTEASQRCAELGAIVNPAVTLGEKGDFWIPNEKAQGHTAVKRRVQLVSMDVLVSATETSEIDSGLKVGLKVLEANVGGKSEGNTINSNRVSFNIPICLPVTDNEFKKDR